MKVPPFDTKRQIASIKNELMTAFEKVLDSGQAILGPEVKSFEGELANFVGAKHVIGVASGTDAIYLSLKALGVGVGDKVLTTPFTFFATASAILNTGAEPVFADIDEKTFNIDIEKVREVLEGKSPVCQRLGIDPKTIKAIIPVHLYGQAANLDGISRICKEFNVGCVEDSAQALGTEYQNKRLNAAVNLGAFSLFPTKNLGAFGDAGFVVTHDDELARKVGMLRKHGSEKKYYHEVIGTNSRLDEFQAALLRVKLKYLEAWLNARQKTAAHYDEGLGTIQGVEVPYCSDFSKHSYHQYTIRVKNGKRDELQKFLSENGVGSTVYYPVPLHLQKAVERLNYYEGDFPVAEGAAKEVLSLPIFPELTGEECSRVISGIRDYFKE